MRSTSSRFPIRSQTRPAGKRLSGNGASLPAQSRLGGVLVMKYVFLDERLEANMAPPSGTWAKIESAASYRRGCAARPATPVRRRACRPLRPGSGSCRPVRQFLREFERLRAVVLLPGALRGRFHGSNHMPTKADREISLQNAGSRRFGDGFRYDWFHGVPRLVTSLVASPKVRLPAGSQSR